MGDGSGMRTWQVQNLCYILWAKAASVFCPIAIRIAVRISYAVGENALERHHRSQASVHYGDTI